MSRRPTEGGAALIVALLVSALAAVFAVRALATSERWLERLALIQDKTDQQDLARLGTDFARMLLAADARSSAVDTLAEHWALPLPVQRHEIGEVGGQIQDLQGRFNLNNLWREGGIVDEQALAAYRRLLAQLGLAPALADALADWIDTDRSPRGQGQEEEAANRRLLQVGELHRIRGYNEAVVARLLPHVWAMDGRQPVNVNTATPQVLAAIQPGLTLAAAEALVATRAQTHFVDPADFRNRLPLPAMPAAEVALAVASSHFLIEVEARGERAISRIQSMVEREPIEGKTIIRWQSVQ